MNISKVFKLDVSQAELDFVDINPRFDTKLFLDPYFLAQRYDRLSFEMTKTVKSFFHKLIELLKKEQIGEAREIFSYLSEPNETCLGLSKGYPKGKGAGQTDADKIFDSLIKSKAVQTGIISDIEDCHIFVENFGKDKLSDMVTNITRLHLIKYTQNQCRLWGIPLVKNVPSGFFWNRKTKSWESIYTDMLIYKDKKIILVPKAIVSFSEQYVPGKYHRHYVLNFLKNEHLRLKTALVQRKYDKDGNLIKEYVTKKSIIENEAPATKLFLRQFTESHPDVFKEFRKKTSGKINSLGNDELATISISAVANYLADKLLKIPAGKEHATEYHRTIVGILEFVFYPDLICPEVEDEIHDGLKRIDITFDNAATTGFFYNLHMVKKIPSQYISVECKNYSSDPKNPEIDQLSGRFAPNRGKVGLLLCRKISAIKQMYKRCQHTYKDDRGLVIPLVDNDLILILKGKAKGEMHIKENILTEKCRNIIMS